MVNPATPPTTPPTTVGVDGVVLSLDPLPELDVDEGAVPVGLPLGPPTPPGMIPAPGVLEVASELVLVALDDEMVEGSKVDEVLMVDEESAVVEVPRELVVEIIPLELLDEEELVEDAIEEEFEIGFANVRLVGPLEPVLVSEDVKAKKTRQYKPSLYILDRNLQVILKLPLVGTGVLILVGG